MVHGLDILVRFGAGVVALIAGLWVVVGIALMLVYRVIGRHIRILERERAGLQQAFDRARLDSLRDGLTGLGNHGPSRKSSMTRSSRRASRTRRSPC